LNYSVKMYFKRGVLGVFSVIKDLLVILSWWETWIPPLITLGIVGFWISFAFAFTLSNPWRSLIVWGLILVPEILVLGYAFISKRKL